MRDGKDGALGAKASRVVVALTHHSLPSIEVAIFARDELEETGEVVASPLQVIRIVSVLSQSHHFGKADKAIPVQVLVAGRSQIRPAAAEVVALEQRVDRELQVV